MAAALTLRGVSADPAARATAATACAVALLLLAHGAWGLVEWGDPSALLAFLIALWILASSRDLYAAGAEGRASSHPLFACYHRGSAYAAPSAGTGRGSATLPLPAARSGSEGSGGGSSAGNASRGGNWGGGRLGGGNGGEERIPLAKGQP